MSFEEALASVAAAHVLKQRERQAECGCHGYVVVTWRAGEPEPEVADACPRCGHLVRRIVVLVEDDLPGLSEDARLASIEADLALIEDAEEAERAGKVAIAAAEAVELAASARLWAAETLAERVARAAEAPHSLVEFVADLEAGRGG
ncbi:MAG: hypothetical protein KC442_07260 [Thermomicrobiales bacterium]|nr:hypothetical protein [Thermomicrobiales bacterium]